MTPYKKAYAEGFSLQHRPFLYIKFLKSNDHFPLFQTNLPTPPIFLFIDLKEQCLFPYDEGFLPSLKYTPIQKHRRGRLAHLIKLFE